MAASPARWRRRKEARPQEILAAALDMFAERGYAATRLDDVARRAGVTKGTLYLYFPNKEELFKAVIRETLVSELIRLGTASELASGGPSIEGLIADFERLAASPIGAIPKLVLGEAANFPEIARFYLDEVVVRGLGMIRGMLQRGVDAGEFRTIDVEHAACCVVAPLLLAVLWKHSLGPVADNPLDIAALCRAHRDLLLNGLRQRKVSQ
jgi:AcrR family transcriptional regulator